ncbi:MAG: M15 family metallopeptidase [Clostridiaceae bacterium]
MQRRETQYNESKVDDVVLKHEDRIRQRKTGLKAKTTSKTTKFLKKIPIIILIAVMTVFAVYKVRPDLVYRAIPASFFKFLNGVKTDIKVLDPGKLNTKSMDITEFINGDKVTYNYDLLLINKDYMLESTFEPNLKSYDDNITLSPGVYENFKNMTEEISKKGLAKLNVISTYRTRGEQTEAYAEDQVTTAPPGASEHEAGLAIDVYTPGFAGLAFIKSETGLWVNENSWKHGFIVRYQKYKDDITGIPFEPWHLRYVGAPHAEIMYDKDLVLEEYLSFLKGEQGKFISTGNYLVTMQNGSKISVPEKYDSATISYTENGYFIATFKVK